MSELTFDHAERLLALATDVSFCGLDQIIESPFGCVGQSPVAFLGA